MNQDQEHLRLLSVFHYVLGGIVALVALFPLIHLMFGLFMVVLSAGVESGDQAPPALVGWIFVIVAATLMALGWTLAVLIIFSGRFLGRQKHYMYCLVIAGFECLMMPLGTVLGVFTIIVLMRESVKDAFSGKPPVETGPPAVPAPQT